jgi:hypothetical protein
VVRGPQGGTRDKNEGNASGVEFPLCKVSECSRQRVDNGRGRTKSRGSNGVALIGKCRAMYGEVAERL